MPAKTPVSNPLTDPNPLGRWMYNPKALQKRVFVVANSDLVTTDLINVCLKDGWQFIDDPYAAPPPEPEPETPDEELERLDREEIERATRKAELLALRESQERFMKPVTGKTRPTGQK